MERLKIFDPQFQVSTGIHFEPEITKTTQKYFHNDEKLLDEHRARDLTSLLNEGFFAFR